MSVCVRGVRAWVYIYLFWRLNDLLLSAWWKMYSIYIVHSRYEAEPLINKDLQRNCAHDHITSHRIASMMCSADRQLLLQGGFFRSFLYSLIGLMMLFACIVDCVVISYFCLYSINYHHYVVFVGMWWHFGCCCGSRTSFFVFNRLQRIYLRCKRWKNCKQNISLWRS